MAGAKGAAEVATGAADGVTTGAADGATGAGAAAVVFGGSAAATVCTGVAADDVESTSGFGVVAVALDSTTVGGALSPFAPLAI
jgi:hypothetical protein